MAFLMLGAWWWIATNVWGGVAFLCVGVLQVIFTLRRAKPSQRS